MKGWDQQMMQMLGVLFGLATYNGVLLDAQFPMVDTMHAHTHAQSDTHSHT